VKLLHPNGTTTPLDPKESYNIATLDFLCNGERGSSDGALVDPFLLALLMLDPLPPLLTHSFFTATSLPPLFLFRTPTYQPQPQPNPNPNPTSGGDGYTAFKTAPSLMAGGNRIDELMFNDFAMAAPKPVSGGSGGGGCVGVGPCVEQLVGGLQLRYCTWTAYGQRPQLFSALASLSDP